MSDEFYITLPSNGEIQQREFPNNTNNSWKIRLSQPIKLEGKWKAGLCSISYPSDSLLHQYLNSLKDDTVLLNSRRMNRETGDNYSFFIQSVKYSDIKDREILSVKDLLNAIFHEEWLKYIAQLDKDDHPSFKLSDGTVANYQYEIKTGDDFISVDTTGLYETDWAMVATNAIRFQGKLLRTFGFIEDETITLSGSSITVLKPGPNLDVKFGSDTRGWSEDSSKREKDWRYGLQKVDERTFPGGDGVALRMDLSWTFKNLRYQSHTKGNEVRSLYVYSSLCEPQMMGSDKSDLLRHVVYNPTLKGGFLYEPHNIQYVGLRQNRIEVIETEIGEVDEDSLAKFHKGNTTITIHFKRVQ